MKKNTLLLLGVLLLSGIVHQANAQARDISIILAEYNNLKDTPLPEMMVINQHFNEADKAVLLDYFENQRALNQPTGNVIESVPDVFYVLNVRGDDNYGTLDGDPPYDTIDSIENPYPITCFADDFARNGDYYALEFLNDADNNPLSRTIVSINSADGSFTTLADIGPDTFNATPTGLAYDFTTDTMYLTANNTLFSVDLTDGSLTEIGAMGTTTSIWLVIDNGGLAYAADISDDNLYSVDLTTGTATQIGPLGIDISFAQEATIDPEDNTLYMAAYTGGGTGGVHTVDVTTGEATLVGDTTPLNAEFGMFSVDGEPVLGIEENKLKNLTLSPNPVSGSQVQINSPFSSEKSVVVYNVLGEKVIDTVVDTSLNVTTLQAGVYMVQITQEGSTVTKKLIKK